MNDEIIIRSGCKVSVVGDSISTYDGYIPEGYLGYYAGCQIKDYGLTDVHDTWWMRIIDALGGELCVNNSYSGSEVSGANFPSSSCEERCSSLGRSSLTADDARHVAEVSQQDILLDLILIHMGTNDRLYGLPVGLDSPDDSERFYGSYRMMLRRIKGHYPKAIIACATLPLAKFGWG